MKRALSKILRKMGNFFKSSLELVWDFYCPLSLPSVDNSFQTHFLKAESTRFCLRNSSIIHSEEGAIFFIYLLRKKVGLTLK